MLAPLGPMIDEVLFEQGAFRPAGELALTLARQLDPKTFPLLLQNYNAGEGLARLSPTLFQLLQYTDADNYRRRPTITVCGHLVGVCCRPVRPTTCWEPSALP